MKKKHVPAYSLHKGTGQAVTRIAGKDHYLGKHGSPESLRRYGELIAGMGSGGGAWEQPPPAPVPTLPRLAPLTVAALAARYDSHARTYYVKGGARTRQYQRVRRSMGLTVELHGSLPADAFGPLALSAVRERMVALDWARKHVNSCVGCVKRVWRWAASMQLVPAATYDSLRTLDGLRAGRTAARETAPVGPVAAEIVEATLAFLRPETADMVRLQRLTAMRAGEVCALVAEEIDRSGPVWLWRPADHKVAHLGKGRVILFGPRAQDVLASHLAAVPSGHVFSPHRMMAVAHDGRRKPGQHYTSNSYQAAIRRACARAGVTPWGSHQLRHAAATELRREFGLEVAQIILGHARADVTQLYAEKNLGAAIDAMRRAG